MANGVSLPGMLAGGAFIRQLNSTFSSEQVLTYCKKIGLADVQGGDSLASFDANLENLGKLEFLHNVAFPQDTSDLHYTKDHHMAVSPLEIYQRMVVHGKGSYCFGQNGLFLGMLRGLGYRALGAAGRVLVPSQIPNAPMVYSGLNHYVILVQPLPAPYTNVTFVVDVGFGGTGQLRPILLADGSDGSPQVVQGDEMKGGWIWGTYPPERHRVIRAWFPESSLETKLGSGQAPQREWHLQVSHASRLHPNEEEPEWRTLFTFTEDEFFQEDINQASFVVSTMPHYIFHHTLICTRRMGVSLDHPDDKEELALWEGSHDDTWLEKWNLQGDKMTRRVGARVLEERTLTTERERLEALRDVFKVTVVPEDEQWIKGRKAALPESS